jgi:hypothetical protein
MNNKSVSKTSGYTIKSRCCAIERLYNPRHSQSSETSDSNPELLFVNSQGDDFESRYFPREKFPCIGDAIRVFSDVAAIFETQTRWTRAKQGEMK